MIRKTRSLSKLLDIAILIILFYILVRYTITALVLAFNGTIYLYGLLWHEISFQPASRYLEISYGVAVKLLWRDFFGMSCLVLICLLLFRRCFVGDTFSLRRLIGSKKARVAKAPHDNLPDAQD
ncbi:MULTISPECIES: hypothetical protein [Asaia]|uniref:hypothetical protein n=1 Tax=Asaia TaxID=91914 RepID=UPI002FC398B5